MTPRERLVSDKWETNVSSIFLRCIFGMDFVQMKSLVVQACAALKHISKPFDVGHLTLWVVSNRETALCNLLSCSLGGNRPC